ncbi:MAG TPA: hypothetical protein VNN08_17130 [Thermoanaerobaculia bacterium]|nr:hypothetical protein [Thermoanaerobaculia bacterium]
MGEQLHDSDRATKRHHGTRTDSRERKWLLGLLILGLVGFMGTPFYVAFVKPWLFPTPIADTKSEADLSQQMFAVFALLPGLIGLGNYAVSQRLQRAFRRRLNRDLAMKCSEAASEKSEEGEADHDAVAVAAKTAEESIAACRTTLFETVVASAMLTGVFLVLAIVSWRGHGTAANTGLIYSGYGAYISTLWYLLARLNASALSPRFLVNSAVKASIAMFIGCTVGHELFAGATGATGVVASGIPANLFCFLIGLFHPLAMKSLKKTAIKTFGGQVVADADFPVLLIEGINDEAADLLEELGIASTQHLATANVPELAERSLYPQERILDWVDQAILAVHAGGRLRELRAAGIHSATEMIALAAYGKMDPSDEMTKAANKRLKDAGERAGFSPEAMLLLVECIKNDPGLWVFNQAPQYEARLRVHNALCRNEPDGVKGLGEKSPVVLEGQRHAARITVQA